MSIDEFSDLMPHSVQVAEPSGTNSYGEKSFGTAVTYQARVVGVIQTVTDVLGQERISKYRVYLNTNSLINPDSQVTLPSGYVPQQPTILSVGTFPDDAGDHHTVLYLG